MLSLYKNSFRSDVILGVRGKIITNAAIVVVIIMSGMLRY